MTGRSGRGVRMAFDSPPAYAWDWLARQRVAWREIRRRLLTARGPGGSPGSVVRSTPSATRAAVSGSAGRARVGDVPDWSADHLDVLPSVPARGPDAASASPSATDATRAGDAEVHDYGALDTRAEVIAALRADYAADDAVRRVVDAVVAEIAFLGRLDVPLHQLGVRSAPRGMRWWWCHLGGAELDDGRDGAGDADDARPALPTQLRLVDVLSGYGDALDV